MGIRVVFFDVGETLIGPRESFGAVYSRVLAPFGLVRPAEEFEIALRESWREMDRLVPPGIDRYSRFPDGERGYWLRFARGVLERVTGNGLPVGFAERVLEALRDAFKEKSAWIVYDDVVPTLATLRRDGVRLGIVSNWDSRLPRVLERLGLASFFDGVTVSSLEGVEKPDPAIFRTALRTLNAEPAEAVHVGDLPEIDSDGARAAGLRALLVDRRRRLDPALNALEDLRPVPEIIRCLRG